MKKSLDPSDNSNESKRMPAEEKCKFEEELRSLMLDNTWFWKLNDEDGNLIILDQDMDEFALAKKRKIAQDPGAILTNFMLELLRNKAQYLDELKKNGLVSRKTEYVTNNIFQIWISDLPIAEEHYNRVINGAKHQQYYNNFLIVGDVPPKYSTEKVKLIDYKWVLAAAIQQAFECEENGFLKELVLQFVKVTRVGNIWIQGADMLRVIALYLFGGVYYDIDQTQERPISDYLTNNCRTPVKRDRGNDAMAAPALHAVMQSCLKNFLLSYTTSYKELFAGVINCPALLISEDSIYYFRDESIKKDIGAYSSNYTYLHHRPSLLPPFYVYATMLRTGPASKSYHDTNKFDTDHSHFRNSNISLSDECEFTWRKKKYCPVIDANQDNEKLIVRAATAMLLNFVYEPRVIQGDLRVISNGWTSFAEEGNKDLLKKVHERFLYYVLVIKEHAGINILQNVMFMFYFSLHVEYSIVPAFLFDEHSLRSLDDYDSPLLFLKQLIFRNCCNNYSCWVGDYDWEVLGARIKNKYYAIAVWLYCELETDSQSSEIRNVQGLYKEVLSVIFAGNTAAVGQNIPTAANLKDYLTEHVLKYYSWLFSWRNGPLEYYGVEKVMRKVVKNFNLIAFKKEEFLSKVQKFKNDYISYIDKDEPYSGSTRFCFHIFSSIKVFLFDLVHAFYPEVVPDSHASAIEFVKEVLIINRPGNTFFSVNVLDKQENIFEIAIVFMPPKGAVECPWFIEITQNANLFERIKGPRGEETDVFRCKFSKQITAISLEQELNCNFASDRSSIIQSIKELGGEIIDRVAYGSSKKHLGNTLPFWGDKKPDQMHSDGISCHCV